MTLKTIFHHFLLLMFSALLLGACAGTPVKPEIVDPKIAAAMSLVKVEDFASQTNASQVNNGQTLSNQIKAALKYEGIKLVAEGEESSVLRGKLNIDPIREKCANSTDPKKPLYICDKNTYVTVDYRLFDQQGKVILTQRVTESVFETEMSHTSAEEAKTQLKSDKKIIADALQSITQKMVATLSAK